MPADSAPRHTGDRSLDFVCIDTRDDPEVFRRAVMRWEPKLRDGSVLVGNRYFERSDGKPGVNRAVDEFCAARSLEVHPLDLNTSDPWWWVRMETGCLPS